MATAVLYYLITVANLHGMGHSVNVSVLWAANAFLLAVLLLRPSRPVWPLLASTFIGAVAANLLFNGLSLATLLYPLANLAEAFIARRVLAASQQRGALVEGPSAMLRFILGATLLAPAACATMGAAIVHLQTGAAYWVSWRLWFVADALGLLILTPVFYELLGGHYRLQWRRLTLAKRWESGLLMALTMLVCISVFVAQRPLLFVIMMPAMLIAFRCGLRGVQIASTIVAITGAVATSWGYGPIVLMSDDPLIRAHFLQMFIVCYLLTQWPVAAALAARSALTQQLQKSERSLHILASQSSVLMLTFDFTGRCTKAVGAARLMPGRPVEWMPGVMIDDLLPGHHAQLRAGHETALDIAECSHSIELRIGGHRGEERDSDVRWLEATFRVLEDEDGRCPGTLMTLLDISARKQEALALVRSAETDSLTGLLNRAGFMARLEQAIRNAPAGSISIAMIDVDRFKIVNDSCGHQTGDAVLVEVAQRISGELRATDRVARLGGDEFVVLLDTADWAAALDIGARLVEAVARTPVGLPDGTSIQTAISCGVAQYDGLLSADRFLHEADVALYQAKRSGRNRMVAA